MIQITKKDLLWALSSSFALGILVGSIVFGKVLKETKKDQDNAVVFVYGYKKGFNAALLKVCRVNNIHDSSLSVGGFTNTNFEDTKKSIEKGQWDFEKMEYKQ